MLVTRAYKTELDLNDKQVTACKQHAGAARWAYHWGLARRQAAYQATKTSLHAIDLHRELNALKKTEFPWLYQVSKCAPQEALRNLDNAFAHFFRRCQLKKEGKLRGKVGYPTFKSKKKGLGSFRLTGSIVVYPDAIQLPRLGRLRLKERDPLLFDRPEALWIDIAALHRWLVLRHHPLRLTLGLPQPAHLQHMRPRPHWPGRHQLRAHQVPLPLRHRRRIGHKGKHLFYGVVDKDTIANGLSHRFPLFS